MRQQVVVTWEAKLKIVDGDELCQCLLEIDMIGLWGSQLEQIGDNMVVWSGSNQVYADQIVFEGGSG